MSRSRKQFLAYLDRQMEAGLPLGVWCLEPTAAAKLGPARRLLASTHLYFHCDKFLKMLVKCLILTKAVQCTVTIANNANEIS
ncbi:olfactory receptor [Cricetulus griseus]|uniref:Olfactory receptor n=1 Tax=Cricetulus griseus TaxID=10029 RepID=A0A061I6W7_CRIGR|nr:olfactory receptor [Cricetulus griseus]